MFFPIRVAAVPSLVRFVFAAPAFLSASAAFIVLPKLNSFPAPNVAAVTAIPGTSVTMPPVAYAPRSTSAIFFAPSTGPS